MSILKKNIKSQIWIENVIYILIGLTIIAVLLSLAYPQIEKIKDRGIITQTLSAMDVLDKKISEVEEAEGSIGKVIFKIAKGRLEINSGGDSIKYILEDTKLELSEVDFPIEQGNFILLTERYGGRFKVSLERKYDNLNITFEGSEKLGVLQAGNVPYNIFIENKGDNDVSAGEPTHLDFSVV